MGGWWMVPFFSSTLRFRGVHIPGLREGNLAPLGIIFMGRFMFPSKDDELYYKKKFFSQCSRGSEFFKYRVNFSHLTGVSPLRFSPKFQKISIFRQMTDVPPTQCLIWSGRPCTLLIRVCMQKEELNIKNSTTRQLSYRLVEFLVFNSIH